MLKLLTQDVKDIMSIIKYWDKYFIFLPNIKVDNIEDMICKWWGSYNTFEECLEVLLEKDEQYNHMIIDTDLLRKVKINKIWNQNK